ncbi:tlc domain-containing protein [Citrus sinensis]|uniref:Tlc domain-containing protein n=1 Tax=Citrus sinensis TaxID=2711 RepID=A0ACB8JH74_CITSI|nr:tlc domain-containing protein [Citrus sinensis]
MADNVSPSKQFYWLVSVFSGIIMCTIVYKLTGIISVLCFKGYRKLSNEKKLEWNNRGFSTFHAFIASTASLYLLLLSDLFSEDYYDELIINRTSSLSKTVLGISIGYFLSDLAMILWLYPALGGLEYVLHHGLSMFSIFLALVSGKAQIYILMVLFTEITTPFVNLRWYLDVAGLKSSNIYICNGVALFLGWLVARILLFIYFFVHMAIHFDQIHHGNLFKCRDAKLLCLLISVLLVINVKEIFPLGFYSLLVVPPMLAIMNVFWFWKIAKECMDNDCFDSQISNWAVEWIRLGLH